MKSVQILVDNRYYTLQEIAPDEWVATNLAPNAEGEYPVSVIVTTKVGQEIQISTDDPALVKALTLLVTDETASGNRMLNYYPPAIQHILEFQALMKAEGFEIDVLSNNVDTIINEAYLTTMGKERVIEWEKQLGIVPTKEDSLEDRRDAVIARIRGQGKLNTALIEAIVNAFTGGTAISYVKDSVLHVEITPPPNNKQYKFDNVVRELEKKKPAHLGLVVVRKYATWNDIKNNFAEWNSIKRADNWNSIYDYLPPQ